MKTNYKEKKDRMLTAPLLVSIALAVVVEGTTDSEIPVCINRRSVRQRHELPCPVRAVCADEWITVRDWFNGTRCREQRIVHNCVCPGEQQCPVGDENQILYDNKKHRMYMCEPKCRLGMCSTRLRAAEELVQYSPDFSGFNYYRINCRCPGHNYPLDPVPGKLIKATTYRRQFFNRTAGITYSEYKCAGNEPLPGEDTVCPVVSRRGGDAGLTGLGMEEDSWA